MPKKDKQASTPERLNLTLTLEQTKKLNEYCLAVANRRGRMPQWIKTKIGRWAIDEWLEKHGKNLDIDFDKIKS